MYTYSTIALRIHLQARSKIFILINASFCYTYFEYSTHPRTPFSDAMMSLRRLLTPETNARADGSAGLEPESKRGEVDSRLRGLKLSEVRGDVQRHLNYRNSLPLLPFPLYFIPCASNSRVGRPWMRFRRRAQILPATRWRDQTCWMRPRAPR